MQTESRKPYYWVRFASRGCTGGKLRPRSIFCSLVDGKPAILGIVCGQDNENVYVDWYEAFGDAELPEEIHSVTIPRDQIEIDDRFDILKATS